MTERAHNLKPFEELTTSSGSFAIIAVPPSRSLIWLFHVIPSFCLRLHVLKTLDMCMEGCSLHLNQLSMVLGQCGIHYGFVMEVGRVLTASHFLRICFHVSWGSCLAWAVREP